MFTQSKCCMFGLKTGLCVSNCFVQFRSELIKCEAITESGNIQQKVWLGGICPDRVANQQNNLSGDSHRQWPYTKMHYV